MCSVEHKSSTVSRSRKRSSSPWLHAFLWGWAGDVHRIVVILVQSFLEAPECLRPNNQSALDGESTASKRLPSRSNSRAHREPAKISIPWQNSRLATVVHGLTDWATPWWDKMILSHGSESNTRRRHLTLTHACLCATNWPHSISLFVHVFPPYMIFPCIRSDSFCPISRIPKHQSTNMISSASGPGHQNAPPKIMQKESCHHFQK